jgi:hypothetical protein
MKKTKFITAFYSDLYGTEIGGRPSRNNHYILSLLSLLKMTDADFLCYTSDREIESLRDYFYKVKNISPNQLKFEVFDLKNTKFKKLINLRKDIEFTKKSDRCIEIQYSKFSWWWNEDGSYENYYWIDAGISHCGLIPNKYLLDTNTYEKYYESSLFNNIFLQNLIDFTDDKCFFIGKENNRNFWSQTVNQKWYNKYESDIHIIGGLFGGKKEIFNEIVLIFEDYVEKILQSDEGLPHEELIMSLMFVNHKELFNRKHFDTWWHENERIAGLDMLEHLKNNKSFYKILEELNGIYE